MLSAAQRLALSAAGEKKDWKRKAAKAQNKPQKAASPGRPVHAVLGAHSSLCGGPATGVRKERKRC